MPNPTVSQIARFLSRLFHPLNIIALTALSLNSHVHQNYLLGVRDTLILVLCLAPGLVYFAIQKRKSQKVRYTQVVFPLFLLGLGATFTIYTLLGNPPTILQGVIISLLVGIGATLIEKQWDMSNHAWVPMSCAALWLPFSLTITLLLLVVGLITGLARLPLRQHTLLQVFVGWLYGFTATYLLVVLILK